jgi:hypothetical protein
MVDGESEIQEGDCQLQHNHAAVLSAQNTRALHAC